MVDMVTRKYNKNSLFWFNCMYGIYKYYYIDIKVRSIGDFLRVLRFPIFRKSKVKVDKYVN
jgi:hypothetical protein